MKRPATIVIAMLIFFAVPAAALNMIEMNGSDLGLGVGARAISMSGAFTALADDASAMYWNPAGLAEMDSSEAMLMMDTDPARYSFKAIVYHPEKWRNSKSKLAIGFARTNRLKYIADGDWSQGNASHLIDLSMIDVPLNYVGGLDSRTNDYRISIAGRVPGSEKLSVGITYIDFECITTTYNAIANTDFCQIQIVEYDALDFGLLYRKSDNLRFGLSMRNPFESTKPKYLNIGTAWFRGRDTFTFDIEHIYGEYSQEYRKCNFIMLRAGWERDAGRGWKYRAGLIVPARARTSTLGDIRSKLPDPKFGGTIGAGYTRGCTTIDLVAFGDPGQSYVSSEAVISYALTLRLRF
ncbi:MAG TPA: UPF0164 family protein [bacterium]|nr:UPF0164 family protein [bacterium]